MNIIYFINMFDYTWSGLQISDIALAMLLIVSIWKLKKIPIKINDTNFILGLFIISIWITMMLNNSQDYFSLPYFILAFIKLLFYSICFLIIPHYLAIDFTRLEQVIKNSIIIICVLGFYQFIAYTYYPSLPYGLIPSFFEHGNNYSSLYSYGGVFRIRSIFGEPAHFSIYLNILYFFLIFSKSKINKTVHTTVVLGVLLSMSLSGIGLLFVNIIIQIGKSNLIKNEKIIIALISTIVLLIIILGNNEYIMYRIFRIVNMTESSGVSRLVGSWEVALKAPFYGVGLGNLNSYGQSAIVKYNYTKNPSKIHNIFAVISLSSGYIGLTLFIAFLFSLFKRNKLELLFIFAMSFTWGQFNNTPFWFLLILINSNIINKQKYNGYDEFKERNYYEDINC